MDAFFHKISKETDPVECPICKPMVEVQQEASLSKTGCSFCTDKSPAVRTFFSLKLANHYLPRVWPGLILALPALLVVPAYNQSLWFHIWMNLAWIYWIYSVYKLHYTLRKKNRSYGLSPAEMAAITAVIGSHPFNYSLELCTVVRAFLPASALAFLIAPAIFLGFALGFWWYIRMFSDICCFISEEHPKQMAPMDLGGLIALFLLGPGLLQLEQRAFTFPSAYAIWVCEALVPIGLAAAFGLLLLFRNRVALLIANDANSPELSAGTLREIGIASTSKLLEEL